MSNDDPKITARLNDVMASIVCPIAGCWGLHGAQSEYYYDHDSEAHVLEVWPIGIEEPEESEGNGREQTEPALLYELAEFEQVKGKPNRQLVDDYCYWLHNWR